MGPDASPAMTTLGDAETRLGRTYVRSGGQQKRGDFSPPAALPYEKAMRYRSSNARIGMVRNSAFMSSRYMPCPSRTISA
jgi:hypothetical protein